MRNILTKIILLSIVPVLAQAEQNVGLGAVATSLMDPVGVVGSFVHGACILIGGSFLFASIIKYFEHRRSPTMVPISTVVFLLLAGLLLLALPLLTYLTSNGVQYK